MGRRRRGEGTRDDGHKMFGCGGAVNCPMEPSASRREPGLFTIGKGNNRKYGVKLCKGLLNLRLISTVTLAQAAVAGTPPLLASQKNFLPKCFFVNTSTCNRSPDCSRSRGTVQGISPPGGLGWVDLDLESSPGWWAGTIASYCPSRMVEHPKSKSTQPRFASK